MTDAPIVYQWTGEAMEPLKRFHNRCAASFVIGDLYTLIPHEERSAASHKHYFATVHDLWQTLPEGMEDRFPNSECLRKYALIRSGYCDERSIVASSKAEARRFAAFIKPMDDYALVTIRECVVTQYTAKSQSVKAMGKADFQASKDSVFRVIAELIGTSAEQAKAA